jgi:hypothetical protein
MATARDRRRELIGGGSGGPPASRCIVREGNGGVNKQGMETYTSGGVNGRDGELDTT